jgi:peptidoglycan hydrolase CwlO-like protein
MDEDVLEQLENYKVDLKDMEEQLASLKEQRVELINNGISDNDASILALDKQISELVENIEELGNELFNLTYNYEDEDDEEGDSDNEE